ncbi:hypothetical protein M378DRAFT_11811 [Amanita muscaria Koide BX008]|uniref:Uncharacterized protein n=1 Tax=Amanita muscaria (strain Koide BX008) TaxID=946122 RepID=A0A0C2WQF7_AMAMK|nr:hypothetical protein M378DRAFT_11811 [Amanita muscaria Koide BX008]
MKSFNVLTLLTLAAALSCGANGSPATNANTDSGFIKRQNKDELATVRKSLRSTFSKAWNDNHQNKADFTQAVVKALWDKNNHYNYVICRVDHTYSSYLTNGVDWAEEYIKTADGTQWLVVVGGAGTFSRLGMFGYENWAWNGVVMNGQDLYDITVNFVDPVTGLGGSHQAGGGRKPNLG